MYLAWNESISVYHYLVSFRYGYMITNYEVGSHSCSVKYKMKQLMTFSKGLSVCVCVCVCVSDLRFCHAIIPYVTFSHFVNAIFKTHIQMTLSQ